MATTFSNLNLETCITSLDYSPLGDLLAVGTTNETAILFKTDSDEIVESQRFDGNLLGVIDVKFNSQGNTLAVSSLDSKIRIYNIDEGIKTSEITCPPMECFKLVFDPTGRNIITCGELGITKFYDIETTETVETFKTFDIFATCISYSKNEKYLAIGNNLGSIFIFDMKNNQKCQKFDNHGKIVRSLAFTSDSSRLISVSDDQHIHIFDLQTQSITLTLTGHKGNINCVDTHPFDPKMFVTSSYDQTIKIWDLNQKDCVENINFHQANVWSVKYSPDGKTIASACENGILAFHKFQS